MVDWYGPPSIQTRSGPENECPNVLLLPASRPGELKRHLPVLMGALDKIRAEFSTVRARMVLPNERLLEQARQIGLPKDLAVQVGNLAEALRGADLAIAKTGTITLECAYFGVPTIALYKTSWITWQIAKRIVTVKYGAMPNLRLNREVYPEFIQDAATAENIGRTAVELLKNKLRRETIQKDLAEVIAPLGTGGAATRAAQAIMQTLAH
jgi:lipid-A-disaccharide synthase